MPKFKKKARQLRLTTPVSIYEKKNAERLAKAEGYESVAALIRQLLSDRHLERRKKAAAKKARATKKFGTPKLARTRPAIKSSNGVKKSSPRRAVAIRKPSTAARRSAKTGDAKA
jgi:hypothetical protein